ncbi:MAG: tetratricopeptide repeat protein [Bacteroidales bacterium]|nr:tetratricopeptide repeat protein [Bacteroidales bacterium]
MTKNVPYKKRKQKDQNPVKARYTIKFLFPEPEANLASPAYLSVFADKIKNENSSRTGIFCLRKEGTLPEIEHRMVQQLSLDQPGREEMNDAFKEGYVVILEPQPIDRQINPNEFFRLPLPENSRQRIYYEISFKGKKSIEQAGLIIPSDALRYLLTIYGTSESLKPALIRMVLQKLGFERKEVVIHQDAPFDRIQSQGSNLLEKIKLNLTWNTTLPVKESRESSLRNLFFTREHPLFRLAFLITALAIFIILPLLSLDSGLSGDDEKHYQHAAKVYRYFSEDDPSALDDPRHKLNFYGQSFDFFTYLLIRLFNLEENPYEARHVMVAITGAAAILVTGLLVKLFAGYAGGWLALVLMFLSPRFLGHSFNNPMDVPFAFGYIFTIYHIILFLKKLPRISTRSAIWIALGIGWTNGIRIGGLVLIPYMFMFTGLYLLIHKWPWKFFSAGWWRFALKGVVTLVLISLAGYLLSLFTWPYALQDIINHPIQSFKVMSNIQVSIRVVYDGMVYWSDHLPWHYIPKNILISVPVIILLGWMASSITWRIDRKDNQGFWYFLLWFTVLFPVVFVIYRESNVYGGWRHIMFIYPSMLALASIAISRLIRLGGNGWIKYPVILVLAAGLFHPLRHIIRNHPNTYIYFNEWSGGINKTFGTFETDYYTNSLKPASDYFIDHILPEIDTASGQPVRIVSNASINYYFKNYKDQIAPFYSRYYDRGKRDWEYAILYCNYIHPYQLNNGLWPPNNTIHEIKVDDVVVAAIVERKNKDDHHGAKLLNEGIRDNDSAKISEALKYLENAVAFDPNNEAAFLDLGNAYSAFLRFEDARSAMDRLLEIYPGYDKALNLKGYTYLVESEVKRDVTLVDDAIRIINQAVQSNYKFYSGYYNLGLCYGLKNEKDNAIYNFKQAIRYNRKFIAAYEKLAELYEFYGDTEMASRVRTQLSRLR